MRHKFHALAAALAMALVAMLVSSAPASAAIVESDHVYLLDSGADTLNATTDWRFWVDVPTLALDQEYWNFTVYGEMVNNTGTATGAAYTVTIYLSDGVINRSVSSTITVVNTSYAKVYGNITFLPETVALFAANESASMYVTLVQSTEKDSWAGEVGIYTDRASGSLYAMIPALISLAVVGMVISVVSGLGQSMQKGFGRRSYSRRKKR